MQREKELWLTNCLLNVETITQKWSYGACLDCCPAYFLAGWREQHNLHNEHGALGRFSVRVNDNSGLHWVQQLQPTVRGNMELIQPLSKRMEQQFWTHIQHYPFWTGTETIFFMYLSVLLVSKVAWMHRNLPSSSKNPGTFQSPWSAAHSGAMGGRRAFHITYIQYVHQESCTWD